MIKIYVASGLRRTLSSRRDSFSANKRKREREPAWSTVTNQEGEPFTVSGIYLAQESTVVTLSKAQRCSDGSTRHVLSKGEKVRKVGENTFCCEQHYSELPTLRNIVTKFSGNGYKNIMINNVALFVMRKRFGMKDQS